MKEFLSLYVNFMISNNDLVCEWNSEQFNSMSSRQSASRKSFFQGCQFGLLMVPNTKKMCGLSNFQCINPVLLERLL